MVLELPERPSGRFLLQRFRLDPKQEGDLVTSGDTHSTIKDGSAGYWMAKTVDGALTWEATREESDAIETTTDQAGTLRYRRLVVSPGGDFRVTLTCADN